jgi:hypothetical protein
MPKQEKMPENSSAWLAQGQAGYKGDSNEKVFGCSIHSSIE